MQYFLNAIDTETRLSQGLLPYLELLEKMFLTVLDINASIYLLKVKNKILEQDLKYIQS